MFVLTTDKEQGNLDVLKGVQGNVWSFFPPQVLEGRHIFLP